MFLNLDSIQNEYPDFDALEFYIIIKTLYEKVFESSDELWNEVLTESINCKNQIEQMDTCVNESLNISLSENIFNDYSDFEAMHNEIQKGNSMNIVKIFIFIFQRIV